MSPWQPALSTGIFGFPNERAARVIFPAIEKYFAETRSGLKQVRLVLFDQPSVEAFQREWQGSEQ